IRLVVADLNPATKDPNERGARCRGGCCRGARCRGARPCAPTIPTFPCSTIHTMLWIWLGMATNSSGNNWTSSRMSADRNHSSFTTRPMSFNRIWPVHDLAEHVRPVVGADGDEISPRLHVIISG